MEHVEGWTGRIKLPEKDVSFDSIVKRFETNDILFGKLRPYLAKVVKPNFRGVCVGEFLVLRVIAEDVSPEFIEVKLRSKNVIDLINGSTYGAKMPRADWGFIGNIAFSYPPDEEQRKIVEYIQKVAEKLDATINRAEREIELILEYRNRLISDTVTGKIDVRGVSVPEADAVDLTPLDVDEEFDEDDSIEEDEGDTDDTD